MSRFSRTVLGVSFGFVLSGLIYWLFLEVFDVTLNFTGDWFGVTISCLVWIAPAAVGLGTGLAEFEIGQIFLYLVLTVILIAVVFLILLVISVIVSAFQDGSILLVALIFALIGAPVGGVILIFFE